MALIFFRQRDIERMDVHDIPEEFANYFETLDDSGKAALVGSRPDLAKALGFVLPELGTEKVMQPEANTQDEGLSGEPDSADDAESFDNDSEEDERNDLFIRIQQNYYEGKDLDLSVKDNMPVLEALTIPDEASICALHRTPLEQKQIKYRDPATGAVYGIILYVCRSCHRVFLKESRMLPVHDALTQRGIPHTFYDESITSQYLRKQLPPHEFTSEDALYVPDTWIEEDPQCPIHNEKLYEVPCLKRYKNREIRFTTYRCDRCGEHILRRTAALELLDRCAEEGIPQIEVKRLVKKLPAKMPIPQKDVHSNFLIENGKRKAFHYKVNANCYQLSESDTVVVSDSIYCNIGGHDDTEEVVALIWLLQKRGGRQAYLFRLGFCTHCQKYYMAQEDYQVLYSVGRPEVTVLLDIDDTDFQITSGEVFNLERDHLGIVEKQISDEVASIKSNSDYVNPYATGDYDDGNLAYAKSVSQSKYGERLTQLAGFAPKPYSYRVDISRNGTTETYYIGAADIFLDGKQQVISANSEFGHDLINYQTIKVQKDGKEYSIKLSRQFEIENACLYGYVNLRTDEDLIFGKGITDPFLVRVLNMRKRQHNLTDIFVTIQENQNRIVNTAFEKNIIVQGCAGSGKTMVLLHRLSSLKYREKQFDFFNQAMILTPNDQFTIHIKGLADELQIGNIRRASVEQYYINTLILYDKEFEPDGKVSSEMFVRQDYVDYIYSNQFLLDFDSAYKKVIAERNAYAEILYNLTEAMGQPVEKVDFSDDAKVITQIRMRVVSMDGLLKKKEAEIKSAEAVWKRLAERKRFLSKQVPESQEFAGRIVKETLPRVYTKVVSLASERQRAIDALEEQLRGLQEERDRVQGAILMFGKRARLQELDDKIRGTAQELNDERKKQDEELPVLSEPQQDKQDDEIIAWMRRVALIIPDVRNDVRLCEKTKEEHRKLLIEFADIDGVIEEAQKKYEDMLQTGFSYEVKQAVQYLLDFTGKYTLLGTYQMVFDEAVAAFKREHQIKAVNGKYHRYSLYTRLLFAMRYFGKTVGNVRFMCVDEGQDLSFNEYKLIYELNQRNIRFNIFGDTNQLIKPGRGISDWKPLEEFLSAEEYQLNENYRNTNQITRFCNSSFGMNVLLTGVDGVNVREIPRKDLETELAGLSITTERIAILVPRGVQKSKYINKGLLPDGINRLIGDKMENGAIALMYVDEVKGIEFDKAYVVANNMSRNEKYIAYTRALTELILVVDVKVENYDDG